MTKIEKQEKEYAEKSLAKGYYLYIYYSTEGYYCFKAVDPNYVNIEKFKEKFAYEKILYSSYEEVKKELDRLNQNCCDFHLKMKAKDELIKNQFPNDEFLQSAVLQIVDKCVAELEKENAELRAEVKNNEDLATVAYMQGADSQKKEAEQQLTKAKEILRGLYFIVQSRIDYENNTGIADEMWRAEQFLKE